MGRAEGEEFWDGMRHYHHFQRITFMSHTKLDKSPCQNRLWSPVIPENCPSFLSFSLLLRGRHH